MTYICSLFNPFILLVYNKSIYKALKFETGYILNCYVEQKC